MALVRHPAAAIRLGICYGRLDVDLAPDAEDAIGRIVMSFQDLSIRHIYTSPSRRCARVADAVGAAVHLQPQVDARLQELDFGDWEGMTWDSLPRDELDRWAASPTTFAAPGGETGAALIARVDAFYAMFQTETGDTVIVSHGGPLRVLAALLREQPIDLLAPVPPLGSAEIFTVPHLPGR